jgi:phosphoenolpyruvate synthase/pyruvate phosphate dikinase
MKESLENVDWEYLVNRRYSPLLSSLFHDGLSSEKNMQKHIGSNTILSNCLYIDGIWYYSGEELRRNEQLIAELYHSDNNSCKKISSSCYAFGDELVSWLKQEMSNPKSLSTEQILQLASQYFDKLTEFLSFLMYPLYLQKHIEEKILQKLEGKVPDDELYILLTSLSKPIKKNFNTDEQIDILSLTVKLENQKLVFDSTEFDNELDKYLEKYAFIGFRGGLLDLWTKDRIIDRIKFILKEGDVATRLSNLEEDLSSVVEKTNKIMEKYQFDEEAKSLVEAAKEIVYMRTYRTDITAMSMFYAYPLLNELASRFNLTFEDLSYFTPEEIFNIASEIPEDIKIRKTGYANRQLNGIRQVSSGDEFEKIKNIINKKISTSNEVKGNPANRGFVSGIARILKDKSEIGKVRKGDILITAMTTPDFIPAMEKAAAFVTDEGGLTCHAAIVSRELKKPCIVGTRIATKILEKEIERVK